MGHHGRGVGAMAGAYTYSSYPYYEQGGYWGTPDRGSQYVSGVWQGTPWSCHGGCYGGYMGGGSAWGPPIVMPAYSGHGYSNVNGIWMGAVPPIYGNPQAVYGTVTNIDPIPVTEPIDPKTTDPKGMNPKGSDSDPKGTDPKGMGANLKFTVPANAKLYVDGRLTTGSGTERNFTTPPLAPGQKFYYEVKAELLVNGTPVIEEKRVIIEAGNNIVESFPRLIAATNGTPASVAGK